MDTISFGFKKRGSYMFQGIIFLNVCLHWIVSERGSQVTLLRFNIIKLNRKLFLSSCGWTKAVCSTGRADRRKACFLSYPFLLTPVWGACLCLTPQVPHLAFPSLDSVSNVTVQRVSTTHLILCYNPQWFNVVYFCSWRLIFNRQQCAMT